MDWPDLRDCLYDLKAKMEEVRVKRPYYLPSSQENLEYIRKLVYQFGLQVKADFVNDREIIPYEVYRNVALRLLRQLQWVQEFEQVD